MRVAVNVGRCVSADSVGWGLGFPAFEVTGGAGTVVAWLEVGEQSCYLSWRTECGCTNECLCHILISLLVA